MANGNAMSGSRSLEQDMIRFFNLSQDIFCIAGVDGYLKTVNPAFTSILGWSVDEALERPWKEFIHTEDLEEALGVARSVLGGKPVSMYRIRSLHKDGTCRCISWDSQLVEGEGLIFSVGRDVTERQKIETVLVESRNELERRVQERTYSLEKANERLLEEISLRRRIERDLTERESRLKEAQEIAHVGSWDYEVASNLLQWSDEIYRIFEIDPEEFGASFEAFLDMVHPDDREAVRDAYNSSVANKTPYDIVHRLKFGDGRIKYVHERCNTIFDDSGAPVRSIGTVQDITERKLVEDQVRNSELQYRLVVEKSSDVIWRMDPYTERFTFASPSSEKIFGYTQEEIRTIPLKDWLVPESRNAASERLREMVEGKTGNTIFESQIFHKNGARIWCEVSASTWYDEKTGKVEIVGVSRDVTDRKQVEQALKDSEERFRQVADVAGDWIWEVNSDGLFLYCSSAVENIIGYLPAELVGQKSCYDFIGTDDRKKSVERIKAVFEDRKPFRNLVIAMTHKDGRVVRVETSGAPILDAEGGFAGYRGTNTDVTDRVRAAESRELLAAVVEHGTESIVVTDTKGIIRYVNPAFEKATGYCFDEAVGANPRILKSGKHDVGFYRNMWETISAGKVWSANITNRKKDGSLLDEQVTISPIRNSDRKIVNYVGVKRDVTREVALQRQLFQSQKMEAIGTLAGGIAHDFNNIIYAITGYTELAMEDLPADTESRHDLEQVLGAVYRASEMVKQILTFSRQGDTERKPVDLAPIIKEGLKFLRSSIPSIIEIRQQIDERLGKVNANLTQIHQVLMNLCPNAAYSMRDSKGIMTVRLARVTPDDDFRAKHSLKMSGDYVELSVSDSGCGIPHEIIHRIFEPYFTTKPVDEGTGMGLAVIHGIVTSYGGAITVQSEPGQGSTFRIFLPVIEMETRQMELSTRSPDPTGDERALLVEDEKILLDMEQTILEHLGYKVVPSIDPENALKIFEADPDGFDFVITDLTMPKLTGLNLASKIHNLRPDIPIILCTGYGYKLGGKSPEEMGVQAVINKPVLKKNLAASIRNVLDRKKQSPKL